MAELVGQGLEEDVPLEDDREKIVSDIVDRVGKELKKIESKND